MNWWQWTTLLLAGIGAIGGTLSAVFTMVRERHDREKIAIERERLWIEKQRFDRWLEKQRFADFDKEVKR